MILRLIAVISILFILTACAAQSPLPPETVEEHKGPATPDMITRADWGWVPLTDSIPTHEIKYITLHHGGEDFPEDKDVIAYLKGLSSWSRSDKGWIDNPYHYMIDLKGQVYEARPIEFPGDTNTEYDVRGHALICVMGNYENQILSPVQFESLALLTAHLADLYAVDQAAIKGHKDYTETLCPGADLYKYLQDGSFLKRVAELRQ